jgi:hypothetical protein
VSQAQPILLPYSIFLTCLILSLSRLSTLAEPRVVPSRATTSLSGQFVSLDQRTRGASDVAVSLSTNSQFVCLDQSLLPVSCERIKKYLSNQMGIAPSWHSKIYLVLHQAESPDEAITITSERFADRWQYRLDLPDVTERARYVRAIVEVLLLEIANRNRPDRSAELPLWLIEGFTRQLLASNQLEIILPPPGKRANNISIDSAFFESRRVDPLQSHRDDPLEQARAVLRSNPILTFEQLSWPADDQLIGSQREIFCCGAQLFVVELLSLKGGKTSLQEMLGLLPQFYNWQLAFLKAFHSTFEQPLDVEKWWNLRWVNFTGIEASQTWPFPESCQKFDVALRATVAVRADKNQLPIETEASLQKVIRDWEPEQQGVELQSRVREFELMQFRLDPEVMVLMNDYRRVIENYLKNSHPSGITAALRKNAAIRSARDETIKELDALDARRVALTLKSVPVAKSKTSRTP